MLGYLAANHETAALPDTASYDQPELFKAMTKVATAAERAPVVPEQSRDLTVLFDRLGDDEIGKRTKSALSDYMLELAETNGYAKFDDSPLVRGWQRRPDQGMREITALLGRVSATEYPEFRAELFRVAGTLNVPETEMMRIVGAEIAESRDPNANLPAANLVITAFHAALRSAKSPATARAFTLIAMERQTDPLMRQSLVSAYLTRFPGEEAAFTAELGRRGIMLQDREIAGLLEDTEDVSKDAD